MKIKLAAIVFAACITLTAVSVGAAHSRHSHRQAGRITGCGYYNGVTHLRLC
jgi:hypothetical protein